jgi:hypothetical protein
MTATSHAKMQAELRILKVLEPIAKQHFHNIETLETRNSDSLDFHDVAIWAIRAALREAYLAGAADAARRFTCQTR